MVVNSQGELEDTTTQPTTLPYYSLQKAPTAYPQYISPPYINEYGPVRYVFIFVLLNIFIYYLFIFKVLCSSLQRQTRIYFI
jgi:hypothetical protein